MPNARRAAALRDVLLGLKDGTHGTHARVSSPGVPLLSAKNITGTGLLWGDDDERISEAEFRAIDRTFSVAAQDLLLTVVGSLGRRALHDGSRVAFQRSVAFLRPDRSQVTPGFLYHLTGGSRFQAELARRSNATAQAGVYLGELAGISIDVPPLPEQRQIAAILDTIDDAIRKTQHIIAKLKQVSQGLLHDLLARGIDENGELRDPGRNPEHFSESVLGLIPRAWEVAKLADVAEVDRGKFTHRPRNDPAFYGGKYPFIQTGDIAAAEGGVLRTASQSLSERGVAVSREFPAGTLAITIAANIADTTILGIAMYFPDSVVGAIVRTPNVVRFVQLCIQRAKRGLDARAPQSAQKNINLQDLRPLLVPRPPAEEQERIALRYDAALQVVDTEERNLEKLSLLKRGLMEDLLTGRVRVGKLLGDRATE